MCLCFSVAYSVIGIVGFECNPSGDIECTFLCKDYICKNHQAHRDTHCFHKCEADEIRGVFYHKFFNI